MGENMTKTRNFWELRLWETLWVGLLCVFHLVLLPYHVHGLVLGGLLVKMPLVLLLTLAMLP